MGGEHEGIEVQKEWGHFTAPITEAEKWKVLYAEKIQELKSVGESLATALSENVTWRARALKAEFALERIKKAILAATNEVQ